MSFVISIFALIGVEGMDEKNKNVVMDMIKSEEMRSYFLELLHEQTEEIISAINSVDAKRVQGDVSKLETQLSQKIEEHNEQKQNLQTLLDEKNAEIKKFSERQAKMEKKNSELIIKNEELKCYLSEERANSKKSQLALEEEKSQLLEKLKEYESNFSVLYHLHDTYKLLPSNIKQRISNIFTNDNVYSMIVTVSDWNNIEGLWGFTKRRIIEDEQEGLEEVVNLFIESFNLFSIIEGSGRYKLINPSVGDRFDSDKHSIKGIKTDGKIEKVLLSGIYDAASKKTVFKAVVQIL